MAAKKNRRVLSILLILVGIGSVVFRGYSGRERGAIRKAQEQVSEVEHTREEVLRRKVSEAAVGLQGKTQAGKVLVILPAQGGQVASRAALEEETEGETPQEEEKVISGESRIKTHSSSAKITRRDASSPKQQDNDNSNKQQQQHTKTVSLVTSFFAGAKSKQHRHIVEIEMALLNNLHNPHLDQVVVVLDGITETSHCDHFKAAMRKLQKHYYQYGKEHHYWNNHGQERPFYHPSKLQCVGRKQGQPSYYDMFRFATDPNIVTTDIVVMANADQAFDDSLRHLQHLKETSLLTISTLGYDPKSAPKSVVQHYNFTGVSLKEPIGTRCGGYMQSWDGYVFYRKLLQGRLKQTDFARKLVPNHIKGKHEIIYRNSTSTNSTHKMALFRMNEDAAEYSALWALLKAAPKDTYNANVCPHISMWHFHGTPKMHGAGRLWKPTYWDWSITPNRKWRFDLVPPPYQFPKYPYQNAFYNLASKPLPTSCEYDDEYFLSIEQYHKARKKCIKTMARELPQ